jgi:dipicolinate synthase subunit A
MRMKQRLFFAVSDAKVLTYAAEELEKRGISVVEAPSADVTHLLLPVPCKMEKERMEAVLRQLPRDITVLGGGLNREELSGYCCVDLLTDERYLAENAMITADCAIRVAANQLPITWQQCPVLILGWGRIGKCLARQLYQLGAQVTVAARKEQDRAMLRAFGYEALDLKDMDPRQYRVIFNTVPVMISTDTPGDRLKIDLASSLGLGGNDVIWARGLPNKDAPESSGVLLARTAIRLTS